MLNLAICDNEPAIIEELEEYLDKISDISFDYEVFFSRLYGLREDPQGKSDSGRTGGPVYRFGCLYCRT